MKKLILLSSLVLLVLSCNLFDSSSEDEGSVVSDNNNTKATAELVTIGTGTNFEINPRYDVDYYKIVIEKSLLLHIKCENVSNLLDLSLSIEDQEGAVFATYTAEKGENVDFAYSCVPGTYYVKIKDNYDTDSSAESISLSFVADEIDTLEANNTFALAPKIDLNQDYYAKILPRYDVDYYKFKITEPSIVNIDIDSVSSLLDIHLSIYDSEMTTLSTCSFDVGIDTTCGFILKEGTYFLLLKDGYNTAFSDKPYHFKLSAYTEDTCEWNNDKENAFPILLNTTYEANIYPKKDIDYYSFNLAGSDSVMLCIDSISSRTDLMAEILDDENTIVKYFSFAAEKDSVKFALQEDTYYLRIKDRLDNAFSEKKYNFRIQQ